MRTKARHVVRLGSDLGLYAVRSGRWWVPCVIVLLIVVSVVVATAKVIVPTVVYTLF